MPIPVAIQFEVFLAAVKYIQPEIRYVQIALSYNRGVRLNSPWVNAGASQNIRRQAVSTAQEDAWCRLVQLKQRGYRS